VSDNHDEDRGKKHKSSAAEGSEEAKKDDGMWDAWAGAAASSGWDSKGSKGKGKGKSKEGSKTQLGSLSEQKLPKDLLPILKFLTMATTTLLAENRMVEGILLDVFLVPTESGLYQAVAAAGRSYADKCEELGRGHNLGPPHVHMWQAMCAFLRDSEAVGDRHREVLKDHLTAWESMEVEECVIGIRMVRVTKCFKSDTKKLWISLDEGVWMAEAGAAGYKSLRRAIITAVGCLEHTKMVSGKAPAGHMESELSALLNRLNN
jgi:hypothetical protein